MKERAMNNICPKCGSENVADAKFCSQCGTALQKPKIKQCKKCGAENLPDAKFCKDCGAQLSRRAEVKTVGAELQKQYLYIFAIGAIALMVVLIYYYTEFIKPLEDKIAQNRVQPTQQTAVQSQPLQQMPPPPSSEEVNAAVESANAHPNDVQAQIHAGNMLFDAGRFPDAIPYYQKALQLDPNNPDVIVDLGVCYYNTSKFPEAKEQFDLALKVDPNHLNALYNVGIVSIHLGDMETLKQAWAKLNQIAPQSHQAQQAMQYLESIHQNMEPPGNDNQQGMTN